MNLFGQEEEEEEKEEEEQEEIKTLLPRISRPKWEDFWGAAGLGHGTLQDWKASQGRKKKKEVWDFWQRSEGHAKFCHATYPTTHSEAVDVRVRVSRGGRLWDFATVSGINLGRTGLIFFFTTHQTLQDLCILCSEASGLNNICINLITVSWIFNRNLCVFFLLECVLQALLSRSKTSLSWHARQGRRDSLARSESLMVMRSRVAIQWEGGKRGENFYLK